MSNLPKKVFQLDQIILMIISLNSLFSNYMLEVQISIIDFKQIK